MEKAPEARQEGTVVKSFTPAIVWQYEERGYYARILMPLRKAVFPMRDSGRQTCA
jgi:hypothetical protein